MSPTTFNILVILLVSMLFCLLSSYFRFAFKHSRNKNEDIELLDRIDVSDRAEYFADLLENNLTFFLNGEWGMGKTEYLQEVEEYSSKKFIYLHLWNIKDERSVIKIGFSLLHPAINLLCRIFLIGSVVVSILVTPAINLGIGEVTSNLFSEGVFTNFIIPVGTILALFVAVWQFFKYKSDDFYYKFFQTSFSGFLLRNKVLIIDDFDRVSKETQEESYKLFNCLNKSLPIIFVGDYSLIDYKEDKYLQKIIDQKMELPYSLYPQNIWTEYFSKLQSDYSIQVDEKFVNLFLEEKRNLRERKMYHYYVNHELEVRGKKNYVQIYQQLAIIYLYLFYPSKYRRLVGGEQPFDVFNQSLWIFDDVLSNKSGYPKAYLYNKQGYYLYEKVLTLTQEEATKLLNEPNLKEVILSKKSHVDDLREYIDRNYSHIEKEIKYNLLDAALKSIFIGEEGRILFTIIEKYSKEFISKADSLDEIILISKWNEKLDENKFDFSQKLYFYKEYLLITYEKLSKIYPYLDLSSEDFQRGKQKKYYFLTFLTINKRWNDLFWPESYWKHMDLIFEEDYLAYLYILEKLKLVDVDYELLRIVVYNNIIEKETKSELPGVKFALGEIKSNLEKLSEKNFTIKYQDERIIDIV